MVLSWEYLAKQGVPGTTCIRSCIAQVIINPMQYVALSAPRSMKSSHILEQSLLNWETFMRQNVVLTILHTQNIYHHVWKTVRATSHCIVGLQSQGNGQEMEKKTYFSLFFQPSPQDWRTTNHQSVILRVFHA